MVPKIKFIITLKLYLGHSDLKNLVLCEGLEESHVLELEKTKGKCDVCF